MKSSGHGRGIRAIRRKNIGEAILLSLFHEPQATLAITQPPNSPSDIESYLQWQDFVNRLNLPVLFEAGVNVKFNELMARCRYVLTTSITEGFGFAFLEPWLSGKAMWGRLLPDVCQGFMDAGIGLDHLYNRLWVPLDWLDVSTLSNQWRAAMGRMVRRFKYSRSHEAIERAWQTITKHDRIDFGLLDEQSQQRVIKKLAKENPARDHLVEINPFLSRPGPPDNNSDLIDRNAALVVRHYSPENYAGRLTHLYTHVANNDVSQHIDKSTLLDAFLDPERFSMLKWGGNR